MLLFTSFIFRPKVQTTSPLQAAAKVLKQWWSCHRLNQVKFTCRTSYHKEASGQGTPSSPSSRDGLPCPSVGNLLPDPQTWLYLQIRLPRWLSGKESACQGRRCRSHRVDPWVRKTPLEEGMAIHSSILVWEIPWTEEPGGLQSLELQSQTWLSNWARMRAHTDVHMHTYTHTHSRDWQEASCSHPSFWHSVEPWFKKKKKVLGNHLNSYKLSFLSPLGIHYIYIILPSVSHGRFCVWQ